MKISNLKYPHVKYAGQTNQETVHEIKNVKMKQKKEKFRKV